MCPLSLNIWTLGLLFFLFINGMIWTEPVETSPDLDYEEYDDFGDDPDDYVDLNSLTSSSNGSIQFVKELSNITRSSGKTLKLKCEVKLVDLNSTNSKVNFTWYKNSGHLPEDPRIIVKNIQKPDAHTFISRLRITHLDYFDRGIYDCVANNGVDKIRTQAFLEINRDNMGPVPEKVPAYKTTLDDSIIRGNSEIDMTETTFFPGTGRKGRDELITAITKPLLPTLSEQTVDNPVLFEHNGTLRSVAEKTIYNSSEPFCQLYVGKSCKNFLEGKYVFVQPPYTQRNIEDKLENAFLVIRQSNDISSSCEKFALPSLCFSAFPLCVDATSVNNYQESFINKYKVLSEKNKQSFKDLRNQLAMSLQRICKKDCELLENELCSKEYAIAKRHPVIRQTLELEECEYLPEENERNSLFCLRLGVDRTQSVNEDDTCFWDNGEMYRGIQEVSVTGSRCIRWSHQFHIQLSEHPELSGHSFCRNPDGMEMEPFCYIDQNKKELCGLPKCARIIGLYIALTAVTFLLVVLLVLFIFCYKKRKAKKPNLQNMNIPSADKNIYGNTGPNSPMEMNSLLPQRGNSFPSGVSLRGQPKLSFQSVPQYTYKELSFVEELGEGAFGKVYKGDLKTKNGRITVAVKSLKENATPKTQSDFQREIELIAELKHPNIICLLGIVAKHEPMCMLFEYMSEGDLHEFLIGNSPPEGKSLTQDQFLHIALQIAQGMAYLSDNHYVHRDLAARNCLVSKDLVVKISDFGLSRDMYSCDYYRVQSKSLLPVRWMAPESILYGKFTTESDVWSYGVVLWEIYSYGLQPYYGYNNQEVINMIRSRKLLPCPEVCPSYCYALMVECWAELAIRRPSFGEIVHRLKMWRQNGPSTGAYFKTPDHRVTLPKPSSKSSHSSENGYPSLESTSQTWEKHSKRASSNKLHDSQSSLTSHASSMGNRTQSTNLSNDQNLRGSKKSMDRKSQRGGPRIEPPTLEIGPKETIVNAEGNSYETKLNF